MLTFPMRDPAEFKQARPFPSLVVDLAEHEGNADLLRVVARSFPTQASSVWRRLGHAHVAEKLHLNTFGLFPREAWLLIDYLNSPSFLSVLTGWTGIVGLAADPSLDGAGLHGILTGGRLDVHVDFNWSESLRKRRRLNVLLYLNPAWMPEWGGALELWSGGKNGPDACERIIYPTLGNMVVFETSEKSWHGHPQPLACPIGVMRKSIALYYYTSEPRPERVHSTIYKGV